MAIVLPANHITSPRMGFVWLTWLAANSNNRMESVQYVMTAIVSKKETVLDLSLDLTGTQSIWISEMIVTHLKTPIIPKPSLYLLYK